MRRVLAIAALIALLSPAAAADNGCDKFAWPLAREQALLAAADKPAVKSGDTFLAMPKTFYPNATDAGA